ncbi:1448_t:CDS:2 [Rhizophagus irregularis]|nr:1448_t:CDS:2 [Rhizophagus irregularis]
MPGQSSCTAKIVAEIFGSLLNEQQIIKRFKLNHGLILTRDNIRPSKQAIIAENGELKIDLYEGQPLVYTYINSEDNNDKPLDICIIFPVAEMIYNGNLLDSYSNLSSFQELHIQNQDETPSGKDKYSNMVTRKRNMRHMRNIQKLYVQDQDEAPLRQSKYSSMVTVRRNKRNLIHAITHPTYPIIGNFVDQLRNGSPFL